MPVSPNEAFLRLVWTHGLYTRLDPPGIEVIDPGSAGPEDGIDAVNARIALEGTEISGPVAIHERASDWRKHLHHIDSKYDRCILHVVAYDDAVVCRTDGSVVPTVTMSCPRELQERYLGLLEGSESYRCGQTLAQMPEVKLYGLLTELTVERLERKYNDFLSLYRETGNDWNETFYVMLFRTMGAGSNREPYMKLARTVRYTDLCKVRESVASVEALLLGGAGLLQPIEFPDRYTAMLQQEFRHLSHRFEIAPMHRREWNLGSHNPHHAPLLRIVELAALLCSQEFMFSRLLGCRTPEQVREVLSVQASVLDHPLSARTAQPVQRQVVRRHDARQSDDQSGSPDDVHLRPRHLGGGTEGSGRRAAGKNQAGKQRLHKRLEVKRRRGGKRFFHARAAAIVERILREKTLRRMQYRQENAVLSIKNTKFTRSFSKH